MGETLPASNQRQPIKDWMTIVQFDDQIQKVDVMTYGEEFARIEIIGRGGNNMHCVANFIDDLEHVAAPCDVGVPTRPTGTHTQSPCRTWNAAPTLITIRACRRGAVVAQPPCKR